MKTNATMDHVVQALENVNKLYDGNIRLENVRTKGRYQFFTLRVKDSRGKGAKVSCRWGKTRRTIACCYHAHRDFMNELFKLDKNCKLVSAVVKYEGYRDFLDKHDTVGNRNMGGGMEQINFRDSCFCGHEVKFTKLNHECATFTVKVMKQSDLMKCPFCILVPEHYREDGTCKCNDPVEQEKMIKEWGYSKEDFARISK